MAQHVHEQPAGDRSSPRPDRVAPQVEVTHCGDRSTVRVVGRVGREAITDVCGALLGLVAVGVRDLVVDVDGAWERAGLLSVLARARTVLAEQGGGLRLVGVAPTECIAASRTAPVDEAFLIDRALPIATCTALRAESL